MVKSFKDLNFGAHDTLEQLLDELNTSVGGKANQADLDAANQALISKANQSDLDTVTLSLAEKMSKGEIFVNIKDFGAHSITEAGYETFDSTTAIQNAINSLTNGGTVFIPVGTYNTNNTLTLTNPNITIKGDGWNSIIKIMLHPKRVIQIQADNCVVRDIQLTLGLTGQTRHDFDEGVYVYGSSKNFLIENVYGNQKGIMVRSDYANNVFCENGTIRNCTIKNTLADGIHITGGSRKIVIENNYLEETGDDAIAVVSYQNDLYECNTIRISKNYTYHAKARGISIVGGNNIIISDNHVDAPTCAGIYLAQETGYATLNVKNVTVANNKITNANTYNRGNDYAGIFVTCQDSTGTYTIQNIIIQGNSVLNSYWKSIGVGSNATNQPHKDIIIQNNVCIGNTTSSGIQLDHTENAKISGNYIKGINAYGVYLDNTNLGSIEVTLNTINDVNQANIFYIDAINIALPDAVIAFNTIIDPYGRYEKAIEADQCPGAIVYGNKTIGGRGLITFSNTSRLAQTNRIVYYGAVPNFGTWDRCDRVINAYPTTGAVKAWTCTASGTFGTLNSSGTNGSITSGTTLLTVNTNTGLSVGNYITIVGVTGVKKVIAISGTSITLDSNADATVSNATVAFSPATWASEGTF